MGSKGRETGSGREERGEDRGAGGGVLKQY